MATTELGWSPARFGGGLLRRHWRPLLVVVLAVAVYCYAETCWLLWLGQKDLIFEPVHDMERTPAALGLVAEEVWIASGTGDEQGRLHSWWIPASNPGSSTLLYLHGNDGNVGTELNRVARLRAIGFNVLLIDYRGYGRSTGGEPSESKVYEDAESAWNFLVTRKRIDPSQIMIYGHSLGGAVAIELATHHQAAEGLIVENTFTSMVDMAKFENYNVFPISLLLNQRFDSIAKAAQLQLPVLIVHGTRDEIVPYHMSVQLFEAVHAPKVLRLIPGGGHENNYVVAPEAYESAIHEFRDRILGSP
jgi:pimeloyl-ACP methyl ester carboxylesterase